LNIKIDKSIFNERIKCPNRKCSDFNKSCCSKFAIRIDKEKAKAIYSVIERCKRNKPYLKNTSFSHFFRKIANNTIEIKKVNNTCVFWYVDYNSLGRCLLHSLCIRFKLSLIKYKPWTCYFFPLISYQKGDNSLFITIDPAFYDLKCSSPDGLPLYIFFNKILKFPYIL